MTINHNNIVNAACDLAALEFPVMVLSTRAGSGMVSIGDAITDRLKERGPVYHYRIEDLLPPRIVEEDLARYRLICERFPFLLEIIYRVPFFYYRKYMRVRLSSECPSLALRDKLSELKIATLIAVSHRPAFWASAVKYKCGIKFYLCNILAEFGVNLGWKYLFWEAVDALCGPLRSAEIPLYIRKKVPVKYMDLPVKAEFTMIRETPGDPDKVLIAGGAWALGDIEGALQILVRDFPDLKINVACADNGRLYNNLRNRFGLDRVNVYAQMESLAPLMEECGSVIAKPGIATIMECVAAGRKLFLLKGLPVSEDNNAGYAIKHLGAEEFSRENFASWRKNFK